MPKYKTKEALLAFLVNQWKTDEPMDEQNFTDTWTSLVDSLALDGVTFGIKSQGIDANGNTVVTFTDDTVVTINKGQDGAQGLPGADGQDGAQGLPGDDGAPGQDGAPGADGTSITVTGSTINAEGNTVVTFSDGMTATIQRGPVGPQGPAGSNGADGASVTITSTGTDASGNATVTFSDNTVLTVPKGPAGAAGTPGTNGQDGATGNPGADGKDGAFPIPVSDPIPTTSARFAKVPFVSDSLMHAFGVVLNSTSADYNHENHVSKVTFDASIYLHNVLVDSTLATGLPTGYAGGLVPYGFTLYVKASNLFQRNPVSGQSDSVVYFVTDSSTATELNGVFNSYNFGDIQPGQIQQTTDETLPTLDQIGILSKDYDSESGIGFNIFRKSKYDIPAKFDIYDEGHSRTDTKDGLIHVIVNYSPLWMPVVANAITGTDYSRISFYANFGNRLNMELTATDTDGNALEVPKGTLYAEVLEVGEPSNDGADVFVIGVGNTTFSPATVAGGN